VDSSTGRRSVFPSCNRIPTTRFGYEERLHWDVLKLYAAVVDGLRKAAHLGIDSIGIDSWGVDFGLLDDTGALLGNPVHYRDSRTDGIAEDIVEKIGAEQLYDTTGIQTMPINTIFARVDAPAHRN